MLKAQNRRTGESPCPPTPLPAPLRGAEEGSFAHRTVTQRLPAIARRIITENDFPLPIVENLRMLIRELPDGRVRPVKEDGGPDVAEWAGYVAPHVGKDWLQVPWFFAEAYFYRRILEATGYFAPGLAHDVDPFETQKQAGLESAERSVRSLSVRVNELVRESERREPAGLAALIHFGLWGNRADMSMWPAGSEARDQTRVDVEDEQAKILVNDTPALVDKAAGLREARIDFIMDNAGFELFCDLCLADVLLASGTADTIHLHVKAHPTFVSDAMVKDVAGTLTTLAADADPDVRALAHRLQGHIDADRLRLREHAFWTAPLAFWEMPAAVQRDLGRATLVFVKGDANYRRLLGDRHWPFTTPFEDIACYFPAPMAALRTLKSEVATGLKPGQPEELSRKDADWLIDGRWGVIQLVDR